MEGASELVGWEDVGLATAFLHRGKMDMVRGLMTDR